MAFELPALPYAQDALEPHISAKTLSFHYGKHHQGYVNKLNAAVEADASLQGKDLETLVKTTSGGVFNNAAQVWNHTFYWNSMSPNGGGAPTGDLAAAIDASYGSFDAFKEAFSNAGATRFGSGWAWLYYSDGAVHVGSTANQDSPLMGADVAGIAGVPLLGLDVWEHAYYLKYQNRRPDYIAAFWNVVDWDAVSARYAAAKA